MVFISLIKAIYIKSLQYRLSHAMGIITQIFWGLMSVFVAVTFYRSGVSGNAGLTLGAIVTYLWLGRMFMQMMNPYPTVGISQMILSGQIAYKMLRPIGLYLFSFMEIVAERLTKALFSLPFVALVALCLPAGYGLTLPHSLLYFFLFLLSTAISLILISVFEMCMEVGSFFSPSFHGISSAMSQLFFLLSGSMIPIAFFPPALQAILHILPFSSVIDTPFMIYLEEAPLPDVILLLLRQCAWCAILIGLGVFLVQRSVKRIEISGG